MGFRSSPYNSVRMYLIIEEMIRGDRRPAGWEQSVSVGVADVEFTGDRGIQSIAPMGNTASGGQLDGEWNDLFRG